MGSVSVCSINCLPDDLLVQILSFLPTKQAASTSLLSKRWRTLFVFNHNLDFDNSIFLHPKKYNDTDVQRSFDDFVDRSLASQGHNIKTFSLIYKNGCRIQGNIVVVDRWRWICNALKHGVTELYLCVGFPIPSKVFNSTTLVKLSLGTQHFTTKDYLPSDISFPALKVLFLDSISFKGDQLSEFLAACPVLEDLTIQYYNYYQKSSYVVSSKTIKKLSVTYNCDYRDDFSKIISFDTPNVVDFYYSDYLRCEFPKSHLDSVAKATLDLHQWRHFENGADLTDLISEIRNVKTLNLTISAVKVIPVCCKGELPMFNNLVDLVFSSIKEGWNVLLPLLLERSPNLKTLALSGLDSFTCQRHQFTRIPPNNQIKMLRIMKYQGSAHELKHLRHFLLNMECLEVVQVYVAASMDDPKKMQLTEDLLKLPASSSKLKIQVI